MAKYKMTKSKGVGKVKRKGTKRRRVGSASGGWMPVLEFAGGVILGGIVGRETMTLIGNMMPSMMADPMIPGIIQVGGGVFLAKEAKAPFVKGIGYGIAGNGGTTIVVSTGIISGPNNMTYRLNGVKRPMGNIKFIAGPTSRIGMQNPGAGNSNIPMISGVRRPANRNSVY